MKSASHAILGYRRMYAKECWGLSYDGMPPPSGEFSPVSVMAHHSCGLRKNGTVACLGLYEDSKPAVQPPDGTFISVSAGLSHACGIRADRNVECWGRHNGGTDLSTPPAGKFFRQFGSVLCMRPEDRSKRDLLEHAKQPDYLATSPRPVQVCCQRLVQQLCHPHQRWCGLLGPRPVVRFHSSRRRLHRGQRRIRSRLRSETRPNR